MRLLVFYCMFLTLTIADAKFTRGDKFQYSNIDGALTIICKGQTKVVTCRDIFLDPWPYDIFMGPMETRAESVELRASVGSGSRTTVVDYNGRTGRSSDINLGVYSLFQKPLLKLGENKIRYALLGKNNNTLQTGIFDVSVTRGKSRSCKPKETHTQNQDDCDHPYSVCQFYFRDQNYCR